MRIGFNIKRLNWYRVLAPVVDEALKRGHTVFCLHERPEERTGALSKAPGNSASIERAPAFSHGSPQFVYYNDLQEFEAKMDTLDLAVVVDVRPPPQELARKMSTAGKYPKWVLVGSSDGAYPIQTPEQADACDLVVLRTDKYVNQIMADFSVEYEPKSGLEELNISTLGQDFVAACKTVCCCRLNSVQIARLRLKTVAVGVTSLDVLPKLNSLEIRNKWGIPSDVPVVALLPCAFGSAFGSYWEESYMARNVLHRIVAGFRRGCVRQLIGTMFSPNDRDVLCGLRKFCDRNDAWLVAKFKHSKETTKWQRDMCDLILADDCLYPHTAVELFSIADLTFGFFTTGSVEAVACGSRYVDVHIPMLPRLLFERYFRHDLAMYDWPGVSTLVDAKTVARGLSELRLADFKFMNDERDRYLARFVGPVDGLSSARILNAIEEL